MAEGGDQPSSFVVIDFEGDLKDFDNEDLVYKLTKSYLEDVGKSGGSKFTSDGFVKNPNSQRLQYVAHYANVKSAERVLKRHEHFFKVNEKNLVLTVRPCPQNLKRILEKETPSSDGEGDGTGNSSNGESSPVDESRETRGQNSNGSSDIEVISHDGANGFTIVDVNKGSARQSSDVSPQARDKARPKSPESSPCSSPENFDEASAKELDQWSRSIVVEDVPEEVCPQLRLVLESKRKGGGNITIYERNPMSNQVLATFEDKKDFKDASTEDSASASESEAKDAAAKGKDDEMVKVNENKSNQSQEAPARDGKEKDDDEQNKDQEEEKSENVERKTEEKQTEDEEVKKEVSNEEELRNKNKEWKEGKWQDEQEEIKGDPDSDEQGKDDVQEDVDNKLNESEDLDADEHRKKERIGRDSDAAGTAAGKEEDGEKVGGATGDANQSSNDEDSLNADKSREPHGRKDETSSRGDSSGSGSGSSLDVLRTPKPIIVRGVSMQNVEIVEVFLEDSKKGGGPVKEFKFCESDGELSVVFEDEQVAERFLSLESFNILENKFVVWAPERKNTQMMKQMEESLERQEKAEAERRTVQVHGVNSSEVADFIVGLMRNRRRGGGEVESESFDADSGILTVQFKDKKFADHFLAQKSISLVGKSYDIHAPGKEEESPKGIPLEEVDVCKNREAEEVSRTVEVHGVQSQEVAKDIVDLLENKRRGGGPVVKHFLNESHGILAVQFEDKTYAEHFLRQEVLKAFGVSYYVKHPLSPDAQMRIASTADEKPQDEGKSDQEKPLNDENQDKPKAIDEYDTGVPKCREGIGKVKDKHDTSEFQGYTEEHTRKPADEPVEKIKESTRVKLLVGNPCLIEVQGIPDAASDTIIDLIFRNKKYSGIADVEVDEVQMLGRGRALLTVKEPQHAEALIEKGSIAYKNHTLTISRPSEPEPVEEAKESGGNHPASHEDLNETPDGYATKHEQANSDEATIDVDNIPKDMAEDTLQMIFENKRYGGGGEVKNMIFEKGQGSAVLTMSDPEVARRLLHQESVLYKDARLTIKKHVEDRSQKPFPARKRSNVPTIEKEQPSISDRTIKISGIPSDMKEDTLQMIVENRRYNGGETDNIVYDQGKGTAVITFKDSDVARTLLRKEVIVYKDNRLFVTMYADKPVEGSEEDQVSSRMVDVSEIPSYMTTDELTMLLENKSGGDVESIERMQNCNTAIATLKDSDAANVLVSNKSVAYKGKRLLITKHAEKVEKKHISMQKKEPPASSNRTIFVSQIPKELNRDYLVMVFESKRFDGGKTEDVDYDREQGTAVVTFEDARVAASLIEKEIVDYKGKRMLITKHEIPAGNDSDDSKASAKELPAPRYTVSGSFNTVKVSGLPPGSSKEMISMYFENKKRSGGGTLKVIEHQKEKGKVVINFDDPKDALEVCKRTHVLSGATLKISALEMPLDDVKSCAIEVKGLGDRATEDFLSMYFENKNRSGGGTVETVLLKKEARTAVVVFAEATAVLGVMKKQPHKLDGAKLEVNVLEPAPPPPLLLNDVDTRRLLAKRLPPSVTRDSLKEYLSPATKAKMVGWTLAVKPSTALLDFSSEPDYLSIRRLVCSKPFFGNMISIRRVPQTSSILVTGMPASITADFVAMYFENTRNGGTGDECSVEMLPDKEGSAIVNLQRPDVIQAVTSRKHLFEKKEVNVKPYYPWLGLISASESSGRGPAKTNSEIQTSLIYSLDPKAVYFILKRPELQKHIENSLDKFNCHIEWPDKGKGEMKLEFKGKEKQKPSSIWGVECEKVLQRYKDELTWKKDDVLQEIWNEFKEKIQDQTSKRSKLIDIAFENDQCEIQYIGLKKDTDEFEKIFKKVKRELEEELERRKKSISEIVTNLKSHQLDLIRTEDFTKKLRQEISNLEFEVRQTEVNLCGMPDVVKKAKLFILEKVTAAVQESFETTESTSKVFAKHEAKPYLLEQLLSKGISASWMCNDRSVVVFVLEESKLKDAVAALRKEVVEEHIQLSKASEKLVQSPQWKEFVKSLYDDNKSVEVAVMGPTVIAASTRNIAEVVQRRLSGFIEKHAISEKILSMDLGVVEVIANYKKDELQKIKAELAECSGSIDINIGEPGFIIRGNETGAAKAERDLLKLTDSISMYDHDIDRPGIPAYFYSKHGKEVLRGIQIHRQVSIQLDNTQSRAKPQAEAGDGAETCRLEVTPGKFMTLMRGDITKFRGDAIVNAANEDLKHIGGVAAAILDAAGPKLEEECWSRTKLEGKLLPGQACVTTAGKLPCKRVIHAVGPRWSGGNKDEENILAGAVDSSLVAAEKESLRSIAIPSISTGIFGFPLDRAIDIIVDAVKSYLIDNPSTTVREVYFIDSDSRAVASLESKLRSIQVDIPKENQETKRGRRRIPEAAPSFRPPQNQEPPPNTSPRVTQGTPSAGFKSLSSDVIQTAEGVRISLVKGSISTLRADVLVNTTGKELNLSHGNVSKSLLDAAGPALQSEVDAKKQRDFDYGQIVVTSGQRLQCNHVYHGSCRAWDNGAGNCERIVRTFMKNLLERAEADRQKSIAIPAIGTGNLKIPHKIAAEIMYSEVEKFSSKRKPMNLLDVRFIVYDKDRESVKAFEDKIRDLLRPGGSQGAAPAAGSFAPSPRATSSGASYAPTPSSSSASSSGPDFSFDLVNKVIKIGTIEMKLKSGDITKERADAIVNSTNERMDMSGGAVAKAILRAGGSRVETECKKAKMNSKRVCVTSGGNLPAKSIIHLVAGYNPSAWKEVIENTLEEAENMRCNDIVFPMLGTGQIGLSAGSMANIMVDAVCEFYRSKHPKSLREIKVCIFQSSMLDEFVDAVSNRGAASRSFRDRAAGALSAASNWIGRHVRGHSNIPEDGNSVDDGDFSEDLAGPTQRTRAVFDPRQQSQEPHEERNPQHLSRIILSIYALSKKAIDDVLKDIEEVIKEYIIDKILNSQQDQERIARLNPEQVERIKNMKNIFPVQIEVETGRMKRIRIRGPPMEVTSVIDQVHNIFQEAQDKEIKKKEEEWIANVAHWEYEDGSDFENYPPEINAIIERAFRDKKPYAEWEEENAKYRLTFQKMVEEFITKPGTAPVKVRRVTKDMDVPSNWETMKNDEDQKRVTLDPNDQEYKDVAKAVMSTAQTSVNQIVKIERIQNKMLYKQYVVRKATMDAGNPGAQNEMTLWHGTSADTLESINRSGFNRSYCGKNAVLYGRGVYFAKNFSYSAHNTYSPPDATGLKHVYQCKVLTGEYTLGNQSMIVPPPKTGSTTTKYDSTVDNATAPTIFVIFYDTQAIPEYLIYFK